MIYVTSDCHFGHDKPFVWEARGFNNVLEMNEGIIERWNIVVEPEDEVYVLGDLIMGVDTNVDYVRRLNGKLHIIAGNHDTERRIELYKSLPNVLEVGYGAVLKHAGRVFYLSHYPSLTENLDDHKKPFKKRVFNLCGHYHTLDKYCDMKIRRSCYHVELDAHDCYPVSIDEIIGDIKGYYEKC